MSKHHKEMAASTDAGQSKLRFSLNTSLPRLSMLGSPFMADFNFDEFSSTLSTKNYVEYSFCRLDSNLAETTALDNASGLKTNISTLNLNVPSNVNTKLHLLNGTVSEADISHVHLEPAEISSQSEEEVASETMSDIDRATPVSTTEMSSIDDQSQYQDSVSTPNLPPLIGIRTPNDRELRTFVRTLVDTSNDDQLRTLGVDCILKLAGYEFVRNCCQLAEYTGRDFCYRAIMGAVNNEMSSQASADLEDAVTSTDRNPVHYMRISTVAGMTGRDIQLNYVTTNFDIGPYPATNADDARGRLAEAAVVLERRIIFTSAKGHGWASIASKQVKAIQTMLSAPISSVFTRQPFVSEDQAALLGVTEHEAIGYLSALNFFSNFHAPRTSLLSPMVLDAEEYIRALIVDSAFALRRINGSEKNMDREENSVSPLNLWRSEAWSPPGVAVLCNSHFSLDASASKQARWYRPTIHIERRVSGERLTFIVGCARAQQTREAAIVNIHAASYLALRQQELWLGKRVYCKKEFKPFVFAYLIDRTRIDLFYMTGTRDPVRSEKVLYSFDHFYTLDIAAHDIANNAHVEDKCGQDDMSGRYASPFSSTAVLTACSIFNTMAAYVRNRLYMMENDAHDRMCDVYRSEIDKCALLPNLVLERVLSIDELASVGSAARTVYIAAQQPNVSLPTRPSLKQEPVLKGPITDNASIMKTNTTTLVPKPSMPQSQSTSIPQIPHKQPAKEVNVKDEAKKTTDEAVPAESIALVPQKKLSSTIPEQPTAQPEPLASSRIPSTSLNSGDAVSGRERCLSIAVSIDDAARPKITFPQPPAHPPPTLTPSSTNVNDHDTSNSDKKCTPDVQNATSVSTVSPVVRELSSLHSLLEARENSHNNSTTATAMSAASTITTSLQSSESSEDTPLSSLKTRGCCNSKSTNASRSMPRSATQRTTSRASKRIGMIMQSIPEYQPIHNRTHSASAIISHHSTDHGHNQSVAVDTCSSSFNTTNDRHTLQPGQEIRRARSPLSQVSDVTNADNHTTKSGHQRSKSENDRTICTQSLMLDLPKLPTPIPRVDISLGKRSNPTVGSQSRPTHNTISVHCLRALFRQP